MDLKNAEARIAKLTVEKKRAIHDLENYKIAQSKFFQEQDKQREVEKKLREFIHKNIQLLDRVGKELAISNNQKKQIIEELDTKRNEFSQLKIEFEKLKEEKKYFENENVKLNNTKVIKVTRKYWKLLNKI